MTTWHAPPELLTRFAREPEALDEIAASSLEQHLVSCAECRATVAAAVDRSAIERSWLEVADVIDRPTPTVAERILQRLGMSDDLARVVGATPGLRVAWIAAIALLAATTVAIGRARDSDALFLVVAPVLPLVSAVLTFLPTEEPGGEAAPSTPMYGAGLALRRALGTLVPTFAVLALASTALPEASQSVAWLLPGLALTCGSLLLTTYVRPATAGVSLVVGWFTLVWVLSLEGDYQSSVAESTLFDTHGQILAVVAAAVAAAMLYRRRDRFATVEVSW